jgi:hypothetical protein
MSSPDLKVKIKTHSGGKINTIADCSIFAKDAGADFYQNTSAVIYHVDTNNIADGDTPGTHN